MTEPTLPTDALLLHAHFVRRVAHALTGGHAAEDLSQDTWVAAPSSPPADVSSLRSWLATVTRNLFRNQRRRDALRTERETEIIHAEPVPAADEILAREELRSRVVAAVLELPSPLREVVLLRYYEDLDSRAIGARLQRPAGTVRWQLHSALQHLRHRLDREHGEHRAAWAAPLAGWQRASVGELTTFLRVAWPVRTAIAVVIVIGAALLFVPELTVLPGNQPSPAAPGPALAQERIGDQEAASSRRTPADLPASPPETRPSVRYATAYPRARLHGIVVAADTGAPVPGADLTLQSVADTLPAVLSREDDRAVRVQARSGPDGAFEWADLPGGRYDLRASDAAGRHACEVVALGSGDRQVTLELPAPSPFRGLIVVKVVGANRQPIAGAEVTVAAVCTERGAIGWNGKPPITGTTGRDGVFRFADAGQLELMEEGLVLARSKEGRSGSAVIPRPEHRSYDPWVEVVVDQPGSVTGRITGVEGRDWSRSIVHAYRGFAYGNVVPDLRWAAFAAQPERDGSFRIESLPAGWYQIDVADSPGVVRVLPKPGFMGVVPRWPEMVEVRAGVTTEARIEVIPAATLRGRVLAAGVPVHGASVIVCVRDKSSSAGTFWHVGVAPVPGDRAGLFMQSTARTDVDGRYEFTQLRPGALDVLVTCPDRTMDARPEIAIGAGESRDLEHYLAADGAIRGVAAKQRTIGIRRVDRGSVVHLLGTYESESFALAGLSPGAHEVGFWQHSRGLLVLRTVEVRAGEGVWVDLRDAQRCSLTGLVVVNGNPAPGLEVRCGSRTAATAADGRFRLEVGADPIASDGTAVLVLHRGLELARQELSGSFGESRDLGALEVAARKVEVRVLDEAGLPISASLVLEGPFRSWDVGPARVPVLDGALRGQWVLPGALTIRACCADGIELSERVAVPAYRDPPAVVLRKIPTGSVSVRVLDADGAAAVGAGVIALEWEGDEPAPAEGAAFHARVGQRRSWHYAHLDAAGVAVLRGLRPGPLLVYYGGRRQQQRYGYGDRNSPFSRGGPPPAEQVIRVRAGETSEVLLTLPR